MAVQVQTSSRAKMVAEVVQNSALQRPIALAHHALGVRSSKSALRSNTAQLATAGLLVTSVANSAMSVHHMVTVTHVRHMGKVATAGFQVMGLADSVQQRVAATLVK